MNDIKIPWPEWKAVRRIGNGSFGSVYEIERQDGFGHTEKAALKVISIPKEESEIDSLMANGYDANSITEYFRTSLNNIMNEYAMMAALKGHSNIVICEDRTAVKQANGIGWDVYIRMELLTPFTKIIKEKEISVEETVKIGKDLLKAISACHEKKIIHRDIKPENIFVTKYGDYKLGDFGVARIMSHTTNATKTGTPYYMAPEVDNNEKYGKEADIYSLGMVLYWLLNNRRLPFEPTDHLPLPSEKEKAYKTRLSGKEVPEPLNGSYELKKVIRKAVAYKPKNRYRTAEEMLSALENAQNNAGKESKLKTDLGIKNIIGKAARPENNKKETSSSKTSAEHADYSETIGNSWGTSNKTIGASADGGRNKNSWTINDDNIADMEKTVGYESTVTPKSSSSKNASYENNHRSDTEYERQKTYSPKHNNKHKSTAVQDKKLNAWKRYLVFALIPLVIISAFLILNPDTGLTSNDSGLSFRVNESTVLAAGTSHTVGLKSDGTVIATGANHGDECDVAEWKEIVAVSAGNAITVGLQSDGTVVATGNNFDEQCNVAGWKNIVAVSAGDMHTVGLKSNGRVVAAGNNTWNQCDVRSWRGIVAISAGYAHTVGLKSDGTVIVTGYNGQGECNVGSWKDIVAVSAGDEHTVGLKSDGTVVATGDNTWGQCDVADWKDIVAISAGDYHTVGLKSDGTVIAAGAESDAERDVSNWKDIVAGSAGDSHTVALKSDGMVLATGDNQFGECDVSDWKDIIAISASLFYTAGLKSDGTVVTAGASLADERVSSWKDITAISAGFDHIVGLKSDGTVVAAGDNQFGECDVADWKDIVAISAGRYYTAGLKTDGTVIAVGRNEHGQCDVADWKDIAAISAGDYHTVGLKSDGTVVAAGDNYSGECDVADWKDIVAISAGRYYTAGLKTDGTVIAVGNNEDGQCDVADWKDIAAISAGETHTVGLKTDGTVITAGYATFSECDVSRWEGIKLPDQNN